MEKHMDKFATWYVTFGLGTPDGRTYTEVKVRASLPRDEQDLAVRHAVVMRYGRNWAFNYPPEDFDDSIARYNLRLRETLIVTGAPA
jgi:hypothetical protein